LSRIEALNKTLADAPLFLLTIYQTGSKPTTMETVMPAAQSANFLILDMACWVYRKIDLRLPDDG
jgi:hypothetical protein